MCSSDLVRRLSEKAGIAMPEVAIYEGEPNAFATGAFRNSALVAVSTGLLREMNRSEAEGVVAHEIAHIANGDMVTMTLVQGVINAFVIFLSRIFGFIAAQALGGRNSDDDDRRRIFQHVGAAGAARHRHVDARDLDVRSGGELLLE